MKHIFYIIALLLLFSCKSNIQFDAQGTFEAVEVIVSSEATGRIWEFEVTEGMTVDTNTVVGVVDSVQLHLQRRQLIAQQSALLAGCPDKQIQVASLREQIANQKAELLRISNMLKEGAATQKQYDDVDAQIRILEGQLTATISNIEKSTTSINNNVEALAAQIAALDNSISKCRIVSPISGTVLVKYVEYGEFVTVGKPLMKIADLNNIYLRAYFTSEQLAGIKLGDSVTVVANFGGDERYDYEGEIVWISSESEFTPKTIQTQSSRANLVYAVKIAVKNDGRLKIGLSGDVIL